MLIIVKADQLGLFDKLVQVKPHVTKDGKVVAAHTAIRHVRAPEHHAPRQAAAPKPAPKPQADLFAEAPKETQAESKPAPKPKPKAPESGDLFADAPSKGEERLQRLRERRDPDGTGDALMAEVDAKVDAMEPGGSHVAPAADIPEPEIAPPPVVAPTPLADFDPDAVPAFGVPVGTSKEERRRINATAAQMVDWGQRHLTPEDTALLRQYSGNGGCGDSLNEFYTDPKVAAAMWHALRAMGLRDGAEVLEPSCATGVYMETAPVGYRVTGVELEPTSAAIATILHPRHEVQNASLERFATQDARQFDAVIGNVPFGLRGGLIKDDKPDLKTAEAYFVDTAIDKVREGGLVALIVPTGLLDSKRDRKVRERLLRKGEFLGAMRMPNTAFEHSHTGVTSDVVFFRRRAEEVAGALSVVDQATLKKLGVWDEDFLSGAYYAERGAPNVLGTLTEGWRAKAGLGDDITVEGSMQGVPEAIAAFKPEIAAPSTLTVAAVLEAIGDEETRERARGAAAKRPYDTAKRGDIKVIDGVQYILDGQPLRWHRVDEFLATAAVTQAAELGEAIERVLAGGTDDGLADRVKAYIEAHGIPAKNPDVQMAAKRDKAIYRLIGAVRPDGSLSDLVAGRQAKALEASFDAAAQTLALDVGYFTATQVAGRWHGGDAETALDHLYASADYALDPMSGAWTSLDNYLSGELWPKLDAAKAAAADAEAKPEDRAKYERQVKALEEAIDPRALEDVDFQLNSAFIPLPVVADFFNTKWKEGGGYWASQANLEITFDQGVYHLSGGAHEAGLLGKYLNRTGVKKEDEWPTIEKWNAEFKAWLCGSEHRDEVEELYNRNFRGFRQRDYSDQSIDLPGLNPNRPVNSYHWKGLRFALETGRGIIADDVGLGKTTRALLLARALKTTGRRKKPMIVVPKHVLANWATEAETWFPGSNIMVIGETFTRAKDGTLKGKEDNAAERNRKLHDITQNDYDFILISQPAWNDLDLDPITKGEIAERDFWVQRGDALGNAGDKKLNKVRAAYEQAVANREFQKRTDAIYFNDLGVDCIIGDEFHAFKNLYAAKNRFGQSPKFLGGSGLSNRAQDTSYKTAWLRDQTGGEGVYGLTATPTKNSPLEIYSMLSYIAPEAFERIGVRNSEEFLDRFCEFKSENILNTRGGIEEALVTVGFKNLTELREIMRRYIDRRTAEEAGLKLPERKDHLHVVPMSEEQKAVYAELREKAEAAAKAKDATGDGHIFSIMDKMGKAAMDLELYDPAAYAGAESPKLKDAAERIMEGAKVGGQVVFADNLGVHDKLVGMLVAGGIPRERIAVVNAKVASSSSKRQNISDAFNSGKLDVVIGNTPTMGEGMNFQKRTRDIHNLDIPWDPSTLHQRNGRGLRQGNVMDEVNIHAYLTQGSFDGYRYQTMSAKKDWMDTLWNGGDRAENMAREGAMSREDLMVMLSADPEQAREDLAKNKVVAMERFVASKKAEAAETFGRLSDMRESYAKLAKKDSPSALRLRVKMDRLKTQLEADPHFEAKHVLDGDKPTLIQPATGAAYQEGVGIELAPDSKAASGGGQFVVTKVWKDPNIGPLVKMRQYAGLGPQRTVKLEDLAAGASTFDVDSEAESAAIAANAPLDGVTSYDHLRDLPPTILRSASARLQDYLKGAMRDYKFTAGYGNIGLVGPDGAAKMASSYEAKAHFDTHDLMLPTPEHKALALAAFQEAEADAKMVPDYTSSRHRSSYSYKAPDMVRRYRGPGGYHDAYSNPWLAIGAEVFGDDFRREANALIAGDDDDGETRDAA